MLRPGPGRGCGASPWQKRGCQVRHWEGPELPREPDGLALTAALDTGPLALDRKAQSQQASPSGPAGGSSEGEEALPSNLGCTFPAASQTGLKPLQHSRHYRGSTDASTDASTGLAWAIPQPGPAPSALSCFPSFSLPALSFPSTSSCSSVSGYCPAASEM